jgi:signal peptidase II
LGNFLALHVTQNAGVAFGALDLGTGLGRLIPLSLTIVLAAVVGFWMVKASSEWRRFFIALIFAGAVSNIIDRLANGAVTDFIEYRWFGEALFAGNLADIWISVGAIGAFGAAMLQHFSRPAKGATFRED